MGIDYKLKQNCTLMDRSLSAFFHVRLNHFVFVSGILSQGEGVLILFDEQNIDKTYESALEVISNMSLVVDCLYQKAKQLT